MCTERLLARPQKSDLASGCTPSSAHSTRPGRRRCILALPGAARAAGLGGFMEGRAAEKVRRVVDIGLTVASDRRAPTVQAFQVCRGPADSLKVDTLLMCCIPSNGTESQPAGRRGNPGGGERAHNFWQKEGTRFFPIILKAAIEHCHRRRLYNLPDSCKI